MHVSWFFFSFWLNLFFALVIFSSCCCFVSSSSGIHDSQGKGRFRTYMFPPLSESCVSQSPPHVWFSCLLSIFTYLASKHIFYSLPMKGKLAVMLIVIWVVVLLSLALMYSELPCFYDSFNFIIYLIITAPMLIPSWLSRELKALLYSISSSY